MEFFEDSSSYVNVLRRRKLNQLWDVSEELFKVDIYRENDVLEKEIDDILNTAGIHCHICNLEVPKLYIKEHNQTSTHQNLLKLTDEALERTRNHIKTTETSNLTIKVENTYFCEICSSIVQNSEKELHEKSNYHKKCDNFNNLLSCFVDSYFNINEKIYDLNCNLENDCNIKNDTAEYIILLSEMQQKELVMYPEPQKIKELPKTDIHTNTDSKIELNKKQTQELNLKKETNQELSKSSKNLKDEQLKFYFDTIKSNKNLEIEYIPKSYVKITALNKDVIIVPVQHFHSYNDNEYCRVCQSEVLEENHVNLEDHISRIVTPVADKNGIREVNDIWSHCIICNELTMFVNIHNQSFKHLKSLKKYHLIRFSRSQMKQKENGHNETGNDEKQSEDRRISGHIDIAPHFEQSYKVIDSKIDSIFPISKKVLEIENDSDESDDFQIVGCKNKPNTNENLPGTSSTSKDHNNRSEIQSVKTDKKLIRKLKQTNYLWPDKKQNLLSKCHLCHVNVKHDKGLIEAHINKDVHRTNYLNFMENNKIKLNNDQECHCEPCDQNILKNKVFKHCLKSEHVNKLKKHINKDAVENAAHENKTSAENTVNKSAMSMNNFKINDKTFLCKICYVNIPKTYIAFKQHVYSAEHFNRYNGIMYINKVQINKDSLHCEICSVEIPLGGELDHINSKSHVDKNILSLEQKNSESISSTSKTEMVKSELKTLPKKSDGEKNEEKMVPLFIKPHFKKANKTDAYCIICEKLVPYSEITTHAESHEHNIKFNLLMCRNGIKINEGNKKKISLYSCITCENNVPKFSEVDHVLGRQHVKNFEGKTSSALVKQAMESDLEYVTFAFISTLPGGNKQVLL